MAKEAAALSRLMETFLRLPGVGRKNAQRMAFYVLSLPEEDVRQMANALLEAKTRLKKCVVCQNYCEGEVCGLCQDPKRDHQTICVVESPQDVLAFERTHEYRGLYHVLGRLMSPMDGIGPDDIAIKPLLARLSGKTEGEIIMATSPTVEGEATAMYIAGLLKPLGFQVTRLAFGVPVGSSLEYADEVTLNRALEGRQQM